MPYYDHPQLTLGFYIHIQGYSTRTLIDHELIANCQDVKLTTSGSTLNEQAMIVSAEAIQCHRCIIF